MQRSILIYDDDLEILEVCKAILKNLYLVETRTNCDNVIDDVLLLRPDVILMDLWIPKIGGQQAITLLKDHEELNKIPVIIFSANDETVKISERIRADGYLKKPFDIGEFKTIIRQSIDGGQ